MASRTAELPGTVDHAPRLRHFRRRVPRRGGLQEAPCPAARPTPARARRLCGGPGERARPATAAPWADARAKAAIGPSPAAFGFLSARRGRAWPAAASADWRKASGPRAGSGQAGEGAPLARRRLGRVRRILEEPPAPGCPLLHAPHWRRAPLALAAKASGSPLLCSTRYLPSTSPRTKGGAAPATSPHPAGSRTMNRAPTTLPSASRRFSAAMRPRSPSTICRLMERPRPECLPKPSPCGRSE